MDSKKFKLRNGVEVPFIGFGTGIVRKYSRKPSVFIHGRIRPVLSAIKHASFTRLYQILQQDFFMGKVIDTAISEGYTLLDSGRIYGYSEVEYGKAIVRNNLPREDIFVTTKVSDMDLYRDGSPNDVAGNLQLSLKYLQLDFVDAYLLHWPHGNWLDIYKQMENAYNKGLVRSIGVCNFHLEHFKQLEANCSIMPMIHQTELHPLNSKKVIRDYCKEHGILIMAHTPTGRMSPAIRNNAVLQKIAKKYGKTIAQVIVRWHYQNGVVPIIATKSRAHMKENKDIFDFALTEEDTTRIDSIDQGEVMLPGNGVDDPRYIYNL